MLGKKREKLKMTEREDGLTDYDVYVMGKQEKILTLLLAAAV